MNASTRTSPASFIFDGPLGSVVAKIMARANRPAEDEAIEELDPAPDAAVLAVGFGPGVGIAQLLDRVTAGTVAGIDPADVMLRAATKRNRAAVDSGRVVLQQATADAIPWPDRSFDGVIAVNSIQLWEPFTDSIAEVARVLRPGGRLITFTHDWAIRKSTGREVQDWTAWASGVCAEHGLTDVHSGRGRAEGGKSVSFTACRAGEPTD